MKTCLKCVSCFIQQSYSGACMATDDVAVQEKIVREALRRTAELRFDEPPPAMGRDIHRVIKEISGVADPYLAVKEEFNGIAMGLYSYAESLINNAADRFDAAVRIAIAGNIVDFGVASHKNDIPLEDVIRQTMTQEFSIYDLGAMRETTARAKNILYLLDNTGEIVFDKLLINKLGPERVTAVVKSEPIINDATMEDARSVGMTDLVKVIENGIDAPGTILPDCSEEFKQAFASADMVIAKGQGNYETLNDAPRKDIFFLLKAKCPVIAEDIGVKLGGIIVKAKLK